jgi:hypothetical protein
MIYIVDIDNTICISENSNYYQSRPIFDRIQKVNQLHDAGHTIIYWTARGMNSGKNWEQLTKYQLNEWGCKYNQLLMNKPMYDVWVDDKANWIFE